MLSTSLLYCLRRISTHTMTMTTTAPPTRMYNPRFSSPGIGSVVDVAETGVVVVDVGVVVPLEALL